MVYLKYQREGSYMKLNQVVVASLVEEADPTLVVECGNILHTIDLVEEDRSDLEELRKEEERLWWRQS
jgi:hypothetical protein